MAALFFSPTKIAGAGTRIVAVLLPIILTGCLELETVLPPTPVDGNESVFATPLAVQDGVVFTANVEPASNNKTGLQTVVRRGERDRQGRWRWQSNVIDKNTVRDSYHTQASIALDKLGYVHVAYDMHYDPWQYSVSMRPRSIDRFKFRGQQATLKQRDAYGNGNVIEFPGLGSAAIPGNQVTYPAFFKDRRGQLYVTYRYAIHPKKGWFDRVFAGGIARYNVMTREWKQIGGDVRLNRRDADLPGNAKYADTRPFAMKHGWWVYQIRLAFDHNNGMHASWLWRKGNSGPNGSHLSYAYSPEGSDHFYRSNGTVYKMPIRLGDVERVIPSGQRPEDSQPLAPEGLYSPARVDLSKSGKPTVTAQPIGKVKYSFRQALNGGWGNPKKVTYSANQLRYDDNGNEWAFANGLTVLQRPVDDDGNPLGDWQVRFKGGNLCQPRVVKEAGDNAYYIHGYVLQGDQCNRDLVSIVRLSGM